MARLLYFTLSFLILLFFGLYTALPVDSGCVNLPPSADFTYLPTHPYTYEEIIFNASESRDPDGFIFSYTWDFGDGNVTTVRRPIIAHSYSRPGNYSVNLIAMDNLGMNSSVMKVVSIMSRVVAAFSYSPLNPVVCKPVTFNASASEGGEGFIASYIWDFGDGNITVTREPLVIHHFLAEGLYVVKLNVTNNLGGWNTASQVLNVSEYLTYPPIADFFFTPEEPRVGMMVTFNGSISDPRGGYITEYRWNFGDDTEDVYGMLVTHCFLKMGEFNVTLNVTDSEGFWSVKVGELKFCLI